MVAKALLLLPSECLGTSVYYKKHTKDAMYVINKEYMYSCRYTLPRRRGGGLGWEAEVFGVETSTSRKNPDLGVTSGHALSTEQFVKAD